MPYLNNSSVTAKELFQEKKKEMKKKSIEKNLGSEDRIFVSLACAIKGAFNAGVLCNAFSSCAAGNW